jgi:hypothetical protein
LAVKLKWLRLFQHVCIFKWIKYHQIYINIYKF